MSTRPASDGRGGVLDAAPPVVLEVDLGPGVRAGFTTRTGGVSPAPWDSLNLGLNVTDDATRVRSNRARASAWLWAPFAFSSQVHGTHVVRLGSPPRDADGAPVDSVGEADAIVATAPGVGLGVLVADCVPVLLADADVTLNGNPGMGVLDLSITEVVPTLSGTLAFDALDAHQRPSSAASRSWS